ncbi:hypothetical protein D3C85_1878580 [compost metagenome]
MSAESCDTVASVISPDRYTSGGEALPVVAAGRICTSFAKDKAEIPLNSDPMKMRFNARMCWFP